MKTAVLTISLCAAALAAGAQTFDGNGKGGFGDVIGSGTLAVATDATTATFTLTTGAGDLNDALILYIDSRAGGITSTANLTDVNGGGTDFDNGRAGVSGTDGLARSTVTFPAGFEPDFAISVARSYAGLFELVENGSHNFVSGNEPAEDNGVFTFTAPLADFDAATGQFAFVGTYLNSGNAYRSNEAFGPSDAPDTNIGNSESPDGNGGDLTFTGFLTVASGSLPVSLARFDAERDGGVVRITWATASEKDNAGFEVERSGDGATWAVIGFVAGAGDAEGLRAYDFRDGDAAAGTRYYRLAQVDFDGEVSYSPVVSVAAGDAVRSFAVDIVGEHPVREVTTLRNNTDADLDVAVFDLMGRTVRSFRIGAAASYRLDASALANGTYLLQAGQGTRRLIVR